MTKEQGVSGEPTQSKSTVVMSDIRTLNKLRLWGGRGPCDGRVEVFNNGEWGVICNYKWSVANEKVICRALGCGTRTVSSTEHSSTDPPKKAWMNEINCTGEEKHLWDCLFNGWGITPCNYDTQHIIINCSGTPEANVVCRELNCGTSRVIPPPGLFATKGSTAITILGCEGTENHLWQCNKEITASSYLPPNTTAAVICSSTLTLSDPDTVKVVLLNGAKESRCFGAVHFNRNGINEAVCSNEWDINDGSAVCKELGCGWPLLVSPGEWTSDAHVNNVFCFGSESSVFHCMANYQKPTDCTKATVTCSSSIEVRLADGAGRCSGRVEILFQGKWMSLPSEGWTMNERNVSISLNGGCWGRVMVHAEGKSGAVCADTWNNGHSTGLCKSLGCGVAVAEMKGERIPGGVTIGSMYCVGTDNLLTQCSFTPNSDLSYCQDRPVYVTCSGSIKPRIQDLKEKCSGNVELFHSGHWYPVCSKVLSKNLLNWICEELHCGTALPGNGTVLNTEETKEGFSIITACERDNLSISDCEIGTKLEKCAQGWARIMLTDLSPCEGRVYALNRKELYSVSGQGWGDKEVQVLCKYLQCGNRVHHESRENSLNRWWEHSYNCNGNETSIWQCKETETPTERKQLYIRCTDNPVVKLVNTSDRCFGTVEVTAFGQAQPVCANQWDQEHSRLLCQQLNCSGAVAHKVVKPGRRFTAHYFRCTGKESVLWQCGSTQRECSSYVSVVCSDSIRLKLSQKCGGTVEIFYGGVWEPVCPEPNMPSQQICSELDCGKAISHTPKVIPKARLLNISLECTGRETYIKHCVRKTGCERKTLGQVYCGKYVPETERAVPVGTIVGVVLGLLLMTVTAVLIFWQWRRKRSSRLRRVARNASIFDSGEYEDVEPNVCEMLAPEVKSSDELPAARLELASRVLPGESDADWNNRQDSVSSSQSEYDDIENKARDSDELMEKEGHSSSNQNPAMENEINGLPGPAPEVIEEDYDDITTSPVVKEPPVAQGMGNCETGGDEEYIQPIE
ncbi:scavenger receptor cysteine-rich type 1 protein M160 [Scleropages formosus]|uniref:scavenger receptor cysteine-rich type 1 protein M160 n=1 Tax=Scleropages formosus TaxID=113540 RepID=UPI0010FA91E3|nr:scavenger receptor cysteine-rich type 1 protein M160-like [Scleropages formosus]